MAAEIRNDPDAFSALLLADLDIRVSGALLLMRQEATRDARLDLVMQFEHGPEIGIEAKFAHEVSVAQLERESAVGRELILLVVDKADAPCSLPEHVSVMTWERVLWAFPSARLSADDVLALSANTVLLERREFGSLAVGVRRRLTPLRWSVDQQPGSSGFPSLLVHTVACTAGIALCSQIQVVRGRPGVYQASIGVAIDPETDLVLVHDAEPAWVTALRLVGPRVEEIASTFDLGLLQRKAPLTYRGRPRRSAQIARQFGLPLQWAKGYEDSYLGFKTAYSSSAQAQAECLTEILLAMDSMLGPQTAIGLKT